MGSAPCGGQRSFRALLRDPRSSKLWLCDDNQPPSPVPEVPEFMHTRGILFWLLPFSMGDDSDDDAPLTAPVSFTPPSLGHSCTSFGLRTHGLDICSDGRAIADHLDTEVPPSQSLMVEPDLQVPATRPKPPSMLMDMPVWDDSGNRNLAETRLASGSNRVRTSTNPDDAALDDLLGRLRAADASIDRLLGTNSDQRHS